MMSVGGVAKFDCLNLSQDRCEVQRVRWEGYPQPSIPEPPRANEPGRLWVPGIGAKGSLGR